jgi:hypothetical protein
MRLPLKYRVALGAAGLLAVGAGIGYAAIPDSQGTIHACMLNATGAIRLIDSSLTTQSLRSHCTDAETEVTWSQRGPQGPPGNTDSTVRHISNFMFDGHAVSTPILSARGEIGTLSLGCGHDANGGNGDITFTQTGGGTFAARVVFYSPEIPSSPSFTLVNGHVTFPWADTPGDNILFELMVEAEPGADQSLKPTLTDIHAFVQHFDFGGCSFYVHVDTSEVNSPETFTP